jgi:hypothetical protein
METKTRLALLVALTLVLCSPVSAGFIGLTIQVEYSYPDTSTLYSADTVVVGPGTELSGLPYGDPRTNIDLSDTNILIAYNSSSWWTASDFNGLHFCDLAGASGAITGVTINPATNRAGLDASRISCDANNIWVNWQGLGFWGGIGECHDTIMSLDVAFGDAVPDASTWMTLPAEMLGAV